jgi:hypothetical protein
MDADAFLVAVDHKTKLTSRTNPGCAVSRVRRRLVGISRAWSVYGQDSVRQVQNRRLDGPRAPSAATIKAQNPRVLLRLGSDHLSHSQVPIAASRHDHEDAFPYKE